MEINSALGRRQFAMKQKQVLSVPDESQEEDLDVSMPNEFSAMSTEFDNFEIPTEPIKKKPVQKISEESMRSFKASAEQKHGKLPDHIKNRLQILLRLKKNVAEVEIEGITFTLQTLSQREYQDIWDKILKNPPENQVSLSMEMKLGKLAKAITHIDGQDAAMVLGTSDIGELIDIYKEFQSEVIDILDTEYKKISEVQTVKPSEVQEVSEQIKK
jgi:hypothetical protein